MTRSDGPVVIVGGGVIGAMCAWFLRQQGRSVTIIDRQRFGSGCSHGNCGFVSPSHLIPLAAPGAMAAAIKGMLRPNSPFSVRPRFSPDLWRWFFKFAQHCNRASMMEGAAALHGLLQSSARLYPQVLQEAGIDCQWEERGLLFVFQSRRGFEHYETTQRLMREEFGVVADPYDGEQLVELEPALKPGLGGAWHFRGDRHLRPDRLMSGMRQALADRGVEFIEDVDVSGFRGVDRAEAAVAGDRDVEGSEFVVAAGALTPRLNQALGLRVPIQPGKGYSITMSRPQLCPAVPMIFEEHRVAITPLRDGFRIGSTMEFAGYDSSIHPRRLRILYASAEHYLREPRGELVQEEWFGWRPMTWDSKPIIDRCPRWSNVWIAAGHNMLGLSMAPATGRLIAEMIDGQPPHVDVGPCRASRF